MKIIIAHLTTHWVDAGSGMEKVICNFANAMVERGHKITILYIDKKEGAPYFPLSSEVKTQNILFENGKQILSEKLPLWLRLYREAARAVSGLQKVQEINANYKGKMYGNRLRDYFKSYKANVVIACSGQSIKYVIADAQCPYPVVGMIHSDITKSFPLLSKPEIEAMKKCDIVQILLGTWLETAKRFLPGTPVIAIGNVVMPAQIEAHPGKNKDKHIICCVGNATAGKNQKVLIQAFERLKEDYPNWIIELWGDYSTAYGKWVSSYLKSKNLDDRIKIMGRTSQIDEVYGHSDIFATPSLTEGFPLALTEAMAAGLPVIGFKTCGGVSGLIEDGVNGYLTEPNVDSFANALVKLMVDATLREQLGRNGRESMKWYKPDIIWNQWEKVLGDVVLGRY